MGIYRTSKATKEILRHLTENRAQTSFSEELGDNRTSCASKNSERESVMESLLSLESWWTRARLSSLEFSYLKRKHKIAYNQKQSQEKQNKQLSSLHDTQGHRCMPTSSSKQRPAPKARRSKPHTKQNEKQRSPPNGRLTSQALLLFGHMQQISKQKQTIQLSLGSI